MSLPTGFDPAIADYYRRNNESRRLTSGIGRVEFIRTQDILRRHLPKPPAVVLDVGGGAGVHACWLARDGYDVHLVDAMPNLVEEAMAASAAQADHPIASCTVADARDLPQEDVYADVVCLLGPLYHLIERGDRLKALCEAYRVLRPGGILFAAVISRFASILDGINRDFINDARFGQIIEDDLRTGVHCNPTDNLQYFTTAYFHRPDEIAAELTEAGFRHKSNIAIEGPTWMLADLNARLNDRNRRNQLMHALRLIETEPSILGSGAHILGIADKPT